MTQQIFARSITIVAAAALAFFPANTDGKPRVLKIEPDGSWQDITQFKWPKRKKPSANDTSGNESETSDQGSAGSSAQSGDGGSGYIATTSPTYTAKQIGWSGRQWRVNSAATKYPDLDHSIQRSATWQKLRFEVRKSDPQMESKPAKRRAELSGSVYGDPTRLPNGQSLWGAFSTVHHPWADPEGMLSTYGIVFGQIHMGSKVGGSPAVAFRRRQNGTFRITTRGELDNKGSVRFEGPLKYGQVHDFVYNLVLHPTRGRLRVWLNGEMIVNVRDQSIGHSAADHYWNVGVYAPGGVTSPVSLELGNHVYPSRESLFDWTTSSPTWPSE